MKTYNSLKALMADWAFTPVGDHMQNVAELVGQSLGEAMGDSIPDYCGGPVSVVESLDDLKYIDVLVADSESLTGWSNLSKDSCAFDSASLLTPADPAQEAYYVFFLANNNNGGPSWYIPKRIADQCTHVTSSYLLTNADGVVDGEGNAPD